MAELRKPSDNRARIWVSRLVRPGRVLRVDSREPRGMPRTPCARIFIRRSCAAGALIVPSRAPPAARLPPPYHASRFPGVLIRTCEPSRSCALPVAWRSQARKGYCDVRRTRSEHPLARLPLHQLPARGSCRRRTSSYAGCTSRTTRSPMRAQARFGVRRGQHVPASAQLGVGPARFALHRGLLASRSPPYSKVSKACAKCRMGHFGDGGDAATHRLQPSSLAQLPLSNFKRARCASIEPRESSRAPPQ